MRATATIFKRVISCILLFFLTACASRILDDTQMKEVLVNEEYDELIRVKSQPVVSSNEALKNEPAKQLAEEAVQNKKINDKKIVKQKSKSELSKSKKQTDKKVSAPRVKDPKRNRNQIKEQDTVDLMPEENLKRLSREPDYEDKEGFEISRRPLSDPFRVGEKVVLDVSYFNMVAGTLSIAVNNFAEVNSEKAYQFEIRADTNSFFSRFYSVKDVATTYVNFENLLPYDLQVKVNESGQAKDIRSVFDWNGLKAKYWEKKVTKKGEEKKQKEWDLKPWSQNVISGIFYLRIFQMKPGKTLKFHLTDEGKDIMVTVSVLRKEVLKTKLGPINTLVLNPQVEVDGVFKPMGDVFLWVTDDDRKIIVGVETKIKIGTIKGKLKELHL